MQLSTKKKNRPEDVSSKWVFIEKGCEWMVEVHFASLNIVTFFAKESKDPWRESREC